MKGPLQITLRDVPRPAALEDEILERTGKLEHFHGRMTSMRVLVDIDGKHSQQGRVYAARLACNVPGGARLASHGLGLTPSLALREAFSGMRRQMTTRLERQRGAVKVHSLEAASGGL